MEHFTKEILPLIMAFVLMLSGMFALRLYNRGDELEAQYPDLYQSILRTLIRSFYITLVISTLTILTIGYWDTNFISIAYFVLLPWIAFTRIRTWCDKSSLLEYRFITNGIIRYFVIAVPLILFSILSILQLILTSFGNSL